MLESLLTSRTRAKLLSLFLSHPDERFHIREVARKSSENYNSVRRELNNLESIGVLLSERKANLRYYRINRALPIYPDLKSIYYKTDGLGDIIRNDLCGIGKIEMVFIYGSVAKNLEAFSSDLDLFIVGSLDEDELIRSVRKIEEKISREINYVWLTPEEYRHNLKKKDPFVMNVMNENRIMLVGGDNGPR
jgi:hypothetical protein